MYRCARLLWIRRRTWGRFAMCHQPELWNEIIACWSHSNTTHKYVKSSLRYQRRLNKYIRQISIKFTRKKKKYAVQRKHIDLFATSPASEYHKLIKLPLNAQVCTVHSFHAPIPILYGFYHWVSTVECQRQRLGQPSHPTHSRLGGNLPKSFHIIATNNNERRFHLK